MEVIGGFDRNDFDEVTKVKAVWNGFQKDGQEADYRLLFRGTLLLKGRAMGWSLEEDIGPRKFLHFYKWEKLLQHTCLLGMLQ